MYFPYMRGKQYELLTIRETAQMMAESHFTPIITPVREQITGLKKALIALKEAGASAIVIVNPEHGELTNDPAVILKLCDDDSLANWDRLLVGIRLDTEVTVNDVVNLCKAPCTRDIALIHAGFNKPKQLALELESVSRIKHHSFMDDHCGKIYQRKFSTGERVLVRDGFERRRRNRDYPSREFFSDLHITYVDENMNGFGDFLIVGDDFSESGGPAYTVAIHLTYIDPADDDTMYMRHFLSDRQDTAQDPGGKFAEALDKLISHLNRNAENKFYETSAIQEFRDLHAREHYPGLGYVKKLSMNHHIETLATYFRKNSIEYT